MYRDRIRCEALQKLGYVVKTLDDKHNDDRTLQSNLGANGSHLQAAPGAHCQASFSDPRRMIPNMLEVWGTTKQENEYESEMPPFDCIIMDYFFMPEVYEVERWKEGFIESTLPALAEGGYIALGGVVWLPNSPFVQAQLQKHRKKLIPFFEWQRVANPECNPLFRATSLVEKKLLRRGTDRRTNNTELRQYRECRSTPLNYPFFVLRRRDESDGAVQKLFDGFIESWKEGEHVKSSDLVSMMDVTSRVRVCRDCPRGAGRYFLGTPLSPSH